MVFCKSEERSRLSMLGRSSPGGGAWLRGLMAISILMTGCPSSPEAEPVDDAAPDGVDTHEIGPDQALPDATDARADGAAPADLGAPVHDGSPLDGPPVDSNDASPPQSDAARPMTDAQMSDPDVGARIDVAPVSDVGFHAGGDVALDAGWDGALDMGLDATGDATADSARDEEVSIEDPPDAAPDGRPDREGIATSDAAHSADAGVAACSRPPEICGDGIDNDDNGQIDDDGRCGAVVPVCDRWANRPGSLFCWDFAVGLDGADRNPFSLYDAGARSRASWPDGTYGLAGDGAGGDTVLLPQYLPLQMTHWALSFDIYRTGGEGVVGLFEPWVESVGVNTGYFVRVAAGQDEVPWVAILRAQGAQRDIEIEIDAPVLADGMRHRVEVQRSDEGWSIAVDGSILQQAPLDSEPIVFFKRLTTYVSTRGEAGSRLDNIHFESDVDGDGVFGERDGCPTVPDADATDSDCDGIGDRCDTDGKALIISAGVPNGAVAHALLPSLGVRSMIWSTTEENIDDFAASPDRARFAIVMEVDAEPRLMLADSGDALDEMGSGWVRPGWLVEGQLLFYDETTRAIRVRDEGGDTRIVVRAAADETISATVGPLGHRVTVMRTIDGAAPTAEIWQIGENGRLAPQPPAVALPAAALPAELVEGPIPAPPPHPYEPRVLLAYGRGELRGLHEVHLDPDGATVVRLTTRGAVAAIYTPSGDEIVAVEGTGPGDAVGSLRVTLISGGSVGRPEGPGRDVASHVLTAGSRRLGWVKLGWAPVEDTWAWEDPDGDGVFEASGCETVPNEPPGREVRLNGRLQSGEAPQVVELGDGFAAVWRQSPRPVAREQQIMRAHVGWDGERLVDDVVLVSNAGRSEFAVASRGDRLALAWVNDGSALHFAQFEPDGTMVGGGEPTVVSRIEGMALPSVVALDQGFRVVWQADVVGDEAAGGSAVYFADLDDNSSLVGDSSRMIDDAIESGTPEQQLAPSVARNGMTSLCIWSAISAQQSSQLVTRAVTGPGAFVDDPQPLDSGGGSIGDLSISGNHDPEGGFGVAWTRVVGNETTLRFRRVDDAGQWDGESRELRAGDGRGSADTTTPQIRWMPESGAAHSYGLVWTQEVPGDRTVVFASRLGIDADSSGGVVPVSDGSTHASHPAIATTPNGIAVVWEQTTRDSTAIMFVTGLFHCPLDWL